MPSNDNDAGTQLNRERQEILSRLEEWLEAPLLILGFVWLLLLVFELLWGLSPFLEHLGTLIWLIFIVDFIVRLMIAPAKLGYIRSNWLTVIALVLPALRVFRIVRLARVLRAAPAARGLRLVRIITSLNRGMGALGAFIGSRGFGYVLALTGVVTIVGGAGMYAFEREAGLETYGAALWWTAMLMTSMGSEYWPKTPEGRLLCLLLAIYGFAVFGYVTATIASFFIGRDVQAPKPEIAEIRDLRVEIAGLKEMIRRLAAAEGDGRA